MNDLTNLEFADNPDPRCPMALILDASSSMDHTREGETVTPFEALNSGLDVLFTSLHDDPLARRRVEVSFVAFGTEVDPATPFATVNDMILPTLKPSGLTSMGAAVNVALDAVEARKAEYKANGIDYFRPWVVLITDGLATDEITAAAERVRKLEAEGKISFFAIAVEGAETDQLDQFTTRGSKKLKGMNFEELFLWLSASQAAVSASTPGDAIALPNPDGWASVEA